MPALHLNGRTDMDALDQECVVACCACHCTDEDVLLKYAICPHLICEDCLGYTDGELRSCPQCILDHSDPYAILPPGERGCYLCGWAEEHLVRPFMKCPHYICDYCSEDFQSEAMPFTLCGDCANDYCLNDMDTTNMCLMCWEVFPGLGERRVHECRRTESDDMGIADM